MSRPVAARIAWRRDAHEAVSVSTITPSQSKTRKSKCWGSSDGGAAPVSAHMHNSWKQALQSPHYATIRSKTKGSCEMGPVYQWMKLLPILKHCNCRKEIEIKVVEAIIGDSNEQLYQNVSEPNDRSLACSLMVCDKLAMLSSLVSVFTHGRAPRLKGTRLHPSFLP